MSSSISITIQSQTWELLPERAVYWCEKRTLIITDLHIGKSGHFRKSGIAAPSTINARNLERLERMIWKYDPAMLLILGDLFHSDANREWLEFEDWLQEFSDLSIVLVAGNHDQLHDSFYQFANISVHSSLEMDGFHFIHDPEDFKNLDLPGILVGGHIHPGIVMKGKGRQSLRFPCFLVSDKNILLPAFGEFTGLHVIKPEEDEKVYAVVQGRIIEL